MLLIEILGFWLLVGVGFASWRRLANRKAFQVLRVAPRSDGRQA